MLEEICSGFVAEAVEKGEKNGKMSWRFAGV
jgi:hypothetical protein